MDDLISRQAALDALEWKWAGKAAIDAIKNLPTAEKKGKWMHIGYIENTWRVSKCSICESQTIDAGNFCPNCGARMEE